MTRDNTELHIVDDVKPLFTAMAEFFLKTSDEAIRERGRFTAPLSNRAAIIAFMIYGRSKANAVYHSLLGASLWNAGQALAASEK